MKELTPKEDNTAPLAKGIYEAVEFNDFHDDVQNAIVASGQALTAAVSTDVQQTIKAISTGGRQISRGTGETAVMADIVRPDNFANPVVITLPLGTVAIPLFVGVAITFEPVRGQLYSVNSLTIEGGGNNIAGSATDFVLDSLTSDNQIVVFVWNGTDWDVKNPGPIAI